jgi:hypothetical protein
LNETNFMELFASFIYQFPLMLVQPMPPSIDECLIYIEKCMVLHLPKSFMENTNTLSYLINKFVTWSLSFLVSWFPITKG